MQLDIVQSSISINETSALGDYMIIVVALAALIVFSFFHLGSNIGPAVKRNKSEPEQRKSHTKLSHWLPMRMESFATHCTTLGDRWRIRFSSTSRIAESTIFAPSPLGYFIVGKDAKESDSIVAPLVRKLLLKYRESFESVRPVSIRREQHSEQILSWLQSEATMRLALFHFLDESLEISAALRVRPELDIHWGEKVAFMVSWNCAMQMDAVRQMQQLVTETEELESNVQGNIFSLTLWLGFSESKIPAHFRGWNMKKDPRLGRAS